MDKNKNHSQSVYQRMIEQLLRDANLLSIQESLLLWAFKGKSSLDTKQIEQLQAIASRVNNITAIKSVDSQALGGESHE